MFPIYSIRITSPSEELFQQTDQLQIVARKLALLSRDKCGLSKGTRSRILACADDLHGLRRFLLHAWEVECKTRIDRDLLPTSKIQTSSPPPPNPSFQYLDQVDEFGVHREFSALLKASLFFLRSLQDGFYRAFHENLTGGIAGRRASMSKAFKEDGTNDKVGNLISEQLPEYGTWFREMRYARNLIKDGTITGTKLTHAYEGADVSICLLTPVLKGERVEHTQTYSFGMKEILTALNISLKLLKFILDQAELRTARTPIS